ncbi:unnamed protein product [Moneuplotes crassus]|uniref:GRIP domain-containing protein n=1 Tax=Euplotes crassus TaxID=5936 RepID=A0AAD1UCV6_EUPCR|nr:unnamed protein product [Moneuplotes crassus]
MEEPSELETITELLREKAKALKATKKKLKKVEDKFVEKTKLYLTDRENLARLLIETYNDPEVQNLLSVEELGSYSYDALKPVLEQAKAREHQKLRELTDADLIPDMQRQIDVYKEEFKNFNDQINQHKQIIASNAQELDQCKADNQHKDALIKELRKDNDHMKARMNSLQKTVQEQSAYIEDVKEVYEDTTVKKADQIMGQFESILGMGQDDSSEQNHLKSRISNLQDENLRLKRTLSEMSEDFERKQSEESAGTPMQESTTEPVEAEPVTADITLDPKYLELMKELTHYKTSFSEKQKALEETTAKLEEATRLVNMYKADIDKHKASTKEYLMKKEKEIERLKNRIKKDTRKGSSALKSGSDSVNKSSELLMESMRSDIPQEFFDESSDLETDLASSRRVSTFEDVALTKNSKSEDHKNNIQNIDNEGGISIEYVKNVYISYLEYKAMKNDKEAKQCEKVLFTALKLSPEQIKEIDKLRKKYKNYKFWKLLPQTSSSKKKKEIEIQNLIANSAKAQEHGKMIGDKK